MKITVYKDFESFYNETITFLEKHAAANNLIAGVLEKFPHDSKSIFMATIEENGSLIGVMLQTVPEQIIISKTEQLTDEQLVEISKQLYELYPSAPGFIGEVYVVKALVNYFTNKRSCKGKVAMEQGVYKLTEVKKAHRNHGIYRLITDNEKEKMMDWIIAFSNEVRMPMSKEEGKERINRFLKEKQLYGLEINGEIVSICAAVRPTKRTITISFVYTPPAYRKQGYASDIVAYVTALKLNSGYKSAALYTDLTNPTSNKIYQEIGYEQVMNSVVIHLEDLHNIIM